MENNKLNGFNNGIDTTDGVGGKEPVTIYEHPINEKPDAYVVGIDPYDVPKTLQNKVFEALGEVSMCWSETPKGVFESSRAEEIGNRLMHDIENEVKDKAEPYKVLLSESLKSRNSVKVDMEGYLKINKQYLPRESTGDFTDKELGQIVKRCSVYIGKNDVVREAVEVLCNALREDEKNVYNLWIDQIQSHVFDEFRKFGGDKPVNGLYEKEITISYKDISELCFNGTKNFLNLLIKK